MTSYRLLWYCGRFAVLVLALTLANKSWSLASPRGDCLSALPKKGALIVVYKSTGAIPVRWLQGFDLESGAFFSSQPTMTSFFVHCRDPAGNVYWTEDGAAGLRKVDANQLPRMDEPPFLESMPFVSLWMAQKYPAAIAPESDEKRIVLHLPGGNWYPLRPGFEADKGPQNPSWLRDSSGRLVPVKIEIDLDACRPIGVRSSNGYSHPVSLRENIPEMLAVSEHLGLDNQYDIERVEFFPEGAKEPFEPAAVVRRAKGLIASIQSISGRQISLHALARGEDNDGQKLKPVPLPGRITRSRDSSLGFVMLGSIFVAIGAAVYFWRKRSSA